MSIKKLGRADLRSHAFLGPCYIVAGTGRFDLEYTEAMRQELQLIGESPKRPYRYYRNSASSEEKEAYDQKFDEFKAKKEEIYKKVEGMIRQEVSIKPLRLRLSTKKDGNWVYRVYKDNIYKLDRANYSDEEIILQIMDLEDEERRKFERLRHKFSLAEKVDKERHREAIPEEVRIAVWRRDSGKCVRCESRENLEYDHIIPVSKGGSNTVRNIELLCEKCNRQKHDKIQ